jgi:hypothetical protein
MLPQRNLDFPIDSSQKTFTLKGKFDFSIQIRNSLENLIGVITLTLISVEGVVQYNNRVSTTEQSKVVFPMQRQNYV